MLSDSHSRGKQDHRDKAGLIKSWRQANESGSESGSTVSMAGDGMTVAQLQGSSGGGQGQESQLKSSSEGKEWGPLAKASSSSFFTRALLNELALNAAR